MLDKLSKDNLLGINRQHLIGAISTVTKSGQPVTGIAENGTPYMSGLKIKLDGPDGKQADMLAVAFDNDKTGFIDKLDAYLALPENNKSNPNYEGTPRPFARMIVKGQLQNNDYKDGTKDENGNEVVHRTTRFIIENVFEAPKKKEAEYTYDTE